MGGTDKKMYRDELYCYAENSPSLGAHTAMLGRAVAVYLVHQLCIYSRSLFWEAADAAELFARAQPSLGCCSSERRKKRSWHSNVYGVTREIRSLPAAASPQLFTLSLRAIALPRHLSLMAYSTKRQKIHPQPPSYSVS